MTNDGKLAAAPGQDLSRGGSRVLYERIYNDVPEVPWQTGVSQPARPGWTPRGEAPETGRVRRHADRRRISLHQMNLRTAVDAPPTGHSLQPQLSAAMVVVTR